MLGDVYKRQIKLYGQIANDLKLGDKKMKDDKIIKAQALIKQKYTVEAIESEWVDVVRDQ